jgi:hypothetical protein
MVFSRILAKIPISVEIYCEMWVMLSRLLSNGVFGSGLEDRHLLPKPLCTQTWESIQVSIMDILFFLVAHPKILRCPSKNETSAQI